MATLSIKTIKISGFRSFRQQDAIEPFASGHNALVGRNGAGKSNFFDAVQFCLLAPRFYNLRQEERQRLLHEGSGATATSAYVEITFDNSSGRVPIEGDDVTLRRAIGAKKDEFFVRSRRPVVWRHAVRTALTEMLRAGAAATRHEARGGGLARERRILESEPLLHRAAG